MYLHFLCDAQHHVLWSFFYPYYDYVVLKIQQSKKEKRKEATEIFFRLYFSACMFIRYSRNRITIAMWTPLGRRVRFRPVWDFWSREVRRVAEVKRVSRRREICVIKNGSKTNSVNVSTHVQLHPPDSVHLSVTMG